MAQNMTENSLFLKVNDMMGTINLLLVFLFSSKWQVVPKREKYEDTKQSCCFDKHLQEECHQKIKVEIRLFSEFTDKDKTVYKCVQQCVQQFADIINCSIVICFS